MVPITYTQGQASSGVRYDRSANLAGRSAPIFPGGSGRGGRSGAVAPERGEDPGLLSRESLERLAQEANQWLPSSTALRFRVDGELEQVVVKVVDSQSNEVIRQIPNEEMIGLVKRMKSFRSGLMNTTV